MVLKVELHCHIEGAASPALVRRKAAKYRIDVSNFIYDGKFAWHDFRSFLKAYDRASMLFRAAKDYADLAEEYLLSLSEEGCIYSEVFISTDHAASAGLRPEDYIGGLARELSGQSVPRALSAA